MLFPVIVALYYGEIEYIPYFLEPIAGILVFGGIVLLASRRIRPFLSARDGFLLVTMSWVTASAAGALPFYLSGTIPAYVDAYFETMSGFTTTGASILTAIEPLPKCILFWRSLTHWLGGMGIVVLTVAVLPILGIGAYRLVKAEAPGPSLDKLTPKITKTAKILWFTYLALTVAETLLLMAGGLDLFDSLTHTFGTLATGGFSPKNTSVGFYNSAYVDIVITVFMVMAGMNFVLYFRLISGRAIDVVRNAEFRAYIFIFITATVLIAISLYRQAYPTFGMSLRYAGFQAASILTTTGYATADFAAWPELAQNVLFALMFIGGCSGSTGGGIKVVRIITVFKLGLNEMRLLTNPRGVFSLRLGGELVNAKAARLMAGFFVLYIFFVLIIALIVATGGNDILTSISTSLVTVGNIGPGFGKIGPTLNYYHYPAYIKWFLSLAMLSGRLEVYTVLVLLLPNFWRRW